MVIVNRRARNVPDSQTTSDESLAVDLKEFNNQGAWILLGEPGAGKSTVFEAEAKTPDGICMRVAEFINSEVDENWREKILFLDGLDEARASSDGAGAIELICGQLKRLKYPKFRITCRAADWFGSTDRNDLRKASPDGEVAVLLLEPLSIDEILLILHKNNGIDQPEEFIENANKFGVGELLKNPQTLGLLAKAIQDERWPVTRNDTYMLSCEKLAREDNKRHRDKKRKEVFSTDQILDAAGQLCSVLLLSDKTGISLDPAVANERFPDLTHFSPPHSAIAGEAIASKLFRPEGEERIVPSHRSIAEYLAARWLARSINNNGLPTKRVLNLLLGCDGCAVAGLRGLYGWLALHSQVARTNLIETDPLTVVVYGDVKPMPITDKRSILAGLRREAESFRAFHREVEAVHPFGALADAELQEDFLAILNSPERDDASQSHTDCVLDVLVEGEALPKLAPALLRIAHDDTRWPRIKHSALKAWLSFIDDPQIKLALLEDINTRRVSADDDELMGMLLSHLYPSHIDPKTLLRYLHTPKIPEFIGKYHWFWTYELVQAAPCDHLSILLDGLIGRSEIQSKNGTDDRFDTMVDSLLACGLTKLDENITDQQLFSWLGLGADKYGHIQREHKKTQIIANWLSMRPERYKAVLDLCFKECEGTENYSYCIRIQTNRLHNAILPHDLGLWHLEQVARTMNDGLAILHLSKTVDALGDQRCTAGLSFKQLEDWGLANPTRKHWLDPLLSCEIPDWRSQEAARKIAQQKESKNAKQSRTDWITQYLNKAEIVPHHVLYELARIWMGPFNEFKGETPIERFNDYCVHGQEALTTAEIEFQRCLVYSDLPTVDQIIDFSKNNQAHYIRLPCLIGIKLLWQRNTKEIERLPAETLRRMIAFLLTSGDDNKPAWFIHVVQQYPELVADVLIAYACATWKAGKDYVNNIFPPDYDSRYRAVAISAIPRLLASFPLRARSVQLRTLRQVLEAALRYQLPDVAALIRKRIAIKGMDVPQRIYWLATASLLHPMNGEKALWLYIGKSHIRASHLSGFLSNYEGKLNAEYQFSASTIGTLIEVIGPHIATAWPHGASWETDATRSSDQVRAFIIRLGAMATSEAAEEIDRLLRLFSHEKLKPLLENARYQLKLRQREKEFRFLPPPQVAQVLANQEPASTSDLAALTLDHLDVIARDIRQDNDDGFRAFWNVEKRYPTNQRDENLFRDALLTRLRGRLDRSSVECQPEGDYANDKRADLRVSFRNKFEVPIEIKRDSNEGLWTSLKGQLINQYAVSPRAHGYGIYLVLWFDGQKIPRPTDGTTKPTSPDELKTRLEAQLDPVELQRISVRVLDVSWPTNTPLQSTSTTKP